MSNNPTDQPGFENPIKEEPSLRGGTGKLLLNIVGWFLILGLIALVGGSVYLVKNYKKFMPQTEATKVPADFPAWMARDGITVTPPAGYTIQGIHRVSISGLGVTTVGMAPAAVTLPDSMHTPEGLLDGRMDVAATAIVLAKFRAPVTQLEKQFDKIWKKASDTADKAATRTVTVNGRELTAFDAQVTTNGVEKRLMLIRVTPDTLLFATAAPGDFDEKAVIAAAGSVRGLTSPSSNPS